uniref:Apple domain-containing protein n=1 Tax=Romanomermis culicivorax TaxID=13658 RepID=A0A915HGM7_ROMCU
MIITVIVQGLNCRAKEKPAYLRSIGYKLDESNDTVAECKKLCSSTAFCEFVVYNTFGKTCTIVKNTGQQQKSVSGKDFIVTSTDLELYQKICIQ